MKAVILAAGYATRLYPMTRYKPKALLTISGKAIIDFICDEIDTIGDIDGIIVISNHRYIGDFTRWASGRTGKQTEERASKKTGSKKIKILVVDDTRAAREIVVYNFRRKGCTVFTAASGEEALPIIIGQKPEVLLVDMRLPGISGAELVRLVREFNKTVKVIMMSGTNVFVQSDPQLKRLNISGFARKPIDVFELEGLIKEEKK
jgi:CheY-like chemotaxis protein